MKTLLVSLLCLLLVACNKPMVFSKDKELKPVSQTFKAVPEAAFEASKKALLDMNYKVEYENADDGRLRTGWVPTTADSHYVEFFDREDYGTNASYYYLSVKISKEEKGGTKVEAGTTIRTIVGKIYSSNKVEKKFLSKVRGLLRSPDFKVTNIGVIE